MAKTVFGQAGKYDAEAQQALRTTAAAVAVLIVVDGNRGMGFSVAADPLRPGAVETAMGGPTLPELLRKMADLLDAGCPPSGGVTSPR